MHLDIRSANKYLGLKKWKRDRIEVKYQGKGTMGPGSKKSRTALNEDEHESEDEANSNWKVCTDSISPCFNYLHPSEPSH
jgi:hypothetical protein